MSGAPWQGDNCSALLAALLEKLPEHPPLYPSETLTDKPERFFASEVRHPQEHSSMNPSDSARLEGSLWHIFITPTLRKLIAQIIREKIFVLYDKEVPYSSEVVIKSFKDSAKVYSIS